VKGPAEGAQAAETDVEANIRYVPIRRAQKKHRALDAPPQEIAMRGLAERSAEGTDEMRLGYFRNSRESWNTEQFRERAIHRIPRAQHPAITLFHRSVHKATLHAERIITDKRRQRMTPAVIGLPLLLLSQPRI
jgi:hypothetical protein